MRTTSGTKPYRHRYPSKTETGKGICNNYESVRNPAKKRPRHFTRPSERDATCALQTGDTSTCEVQFSTVKAV